MRTWAPGQVQGEPGHLGRVQGEPGHLGRGHLLCGHWVHLAGPSAPSGRDCVTLTLYSQGSCWTWKMINMKTIKKQNQSVCHQLNLLIFQQQVFRDSPHATPQVEGPIPLPLLLGTHSRALLPLHNICNCLRQIAPASGMLMKPILSMAPRKTLQITRDCSLAPTWDQHDGLLG